MSYTNGIGSAQLLLTAVSTASAASRVQSDQAAGGTPTTGQLGDANDHTTFSATGSLIAQVSSGPDVRMDKVASLQQAIAAGTYSVSASDVADKLMTALTR